ncbi:hypothetical protein EHQ23_19325 [Leptospira bourretii]|uniref:Uncharacterized protein n=2 Tax=Leptospira TaxID=171 RepID=A0A4V3JLP8_9LEPT|nr:MULTISPECIES: hypothetical protein [Leptospira]TGK79209.1 hypothetical protein EHQ23_19325 [Leptospira bourretii]TGK94390.1 hypothetical protein EHQ26_03400 [Leptospira bourretii]TGL05011.1 hypothetical protein EHQ43_10245 [Leptospira bouyouniensis]TGL16811.1 hypothetical protein EHQ42_10805 [Leptospira levettii]TGL38860.1 hypothetical protein EHQ45_04630 [Leptospira bourretii]
MSLPMQGTQDSNVETKQKATKVVDSSPNKELVKDPTAKFIESKPELARYSMAQVFREFLVKNHEKFNGLKAKDDYEKAFQEFWGVKK